MDTSGSDTKTKGAPYSTEQLEPVRRALQHRRLQLVDSAAAEARELADEAERAPAAEEEEAAAHQHTLFVAARVREGMQREVQLVDAAIARIDAGVYGRCDECGEPIALERLRILPYTRLCASDAALDERDKVARSPGRSRSL